MPNSVPMRLLNAFAGLSLLLASAATSTVSAQCPPDTEAPVITNMPDDITGTADAGLCGTTVSWDLPTATDNCEVTYFHADQVPNDFYAVGITTVTYTAMDAEGNISANSFTITITDDEDPSISDMPADISVNNDSGDCSAVVTWDAPSADDNCGIGSFTSNHDSGDSFPVGTTTVTYTATDVNGSSVTASFDITVTDNEDPTIAGTPANIIQTADNGDCAALVTWTPPTSADNCSTTLTSTHNPGDSFNVGSTTVTYTSTDASSNVATSSFTVTVTDNESPVITQMTGISATNDADNCSAVVTWTDPAVTDNCANSTLTPDIASGTAFDVGVTAVTYTATDIHGNSSTMSFNVTVTDTQDPVISDMPGDIIQAADAGVCSAVVNWAEPTAADNCTTDALGNPANITLSSSPASGSSFDLGTTAVTYTAIDIYGNTTTSTFTVTINNSDSDSDGICDNADNCSDTNACNYADPANAACETPVGCDTCSDGTGTGDVVDNDADDDGTCDSADGCPNDPAKTEPGICGCGNVDTDVDSDGVCDDSDNCTDISACNFDDLANGPCQVLDECDVCGGTGIPAGDCDCDGNQLDALNVCGGTCAADADGDGICDDSDNCTDISACNYADPSNDACINPNGCETCSNSDGTGGVDANDDDGDGTCNADDGCPNDPFKTEPGLCGCGYVDTDVDSDGVCDDSDNCTDISACNFDDLANGPCQVLDECDVCGGTGIPAGDCDCDGNQLDALNVCGGTCAADADGDGICDDSDNCTDISACNYADPSNDACINPNGCETCSNSDGTGGVDANDDDGDGTCNADDGCPNDPAKTVPGICGCGNVDTDLDSDGLCDDSDNCTDLSACNYAAADNAACDTPIGCDTCSDATGTGTIVDNDADDDGTCDSADGCPNDPAKTEPGACGCGNVDNDADEDGVCDSDEITGCTDASACNYDSTPTTDTDNTLCTYTVDPCDTCSGATDGTGTVLDNDADNDGTCDSADGCPNDPAKTAPGVCGCGNVDTDVDSDGVCDDNDLCTDPLANNYQSPGGEECAPCPNAPIFNGISPVTAATTMTSSDGAISLDITGNPATMLVLEGINGAPNYTIALPDALDDLQAGYYIAKVQDDDGCWGVDGTSPGGTTLQQPAVCLELIIPFDLCCSGCGINDTDADGICDDDDNCTDQTAPNFADPANTDCEP